MKTSIIISLVAAFCAGIAFLAGAVLAEEFAKENYFYSEEFEVVEIGETELYGEATRLYTQGIAFEDNEVVAHYVKELQLQKGDTITIYWPTVAAETSQWDYVSHITKEEETK